jgi:hypothetical protein
MVQGDDIILSKLSNPKIKVPKYCYKLNLKHVPFKEKVLAPTTKPYTSLS